MPLRTRALLFSTVALFLASPATAGEHFTTATAGFEFHSNPLYGWYGNDRLSDRVSRFTARRGVYRDLSLATKLTLSLDLDVARHARLDALDTISPGLSARLTRKLGIGYYATMLFVEGDVERIDARERLLDGARVELRVGAEKWLRRKVRGRIFVSEDRRWSTGWTEAGGRRNEVYDLRGASAGLELDYVPDERWKVRLGAGERHGDGVVHYGMMIPGYGDFAWYSTSDYGPVMWGYRLEGFDMRRLSLGVDRALSDRETVSLSHERRASRRNEFVYLSETTAVSYHRAF